MLPKPVRASESQQRTAAEDAADLAAEEDYFDVRTAMSRYITKIEIDFIDKMIGQLGRRPAIAVDAGAGRGRLTRLLAERAEHVIATEAKEQLIEPLSDIAPNVTSHFVDSQSIGLPVQDNSVDIVIAIQAADLTHSLEFHRECARVLRPDGFAILSLQNRSSWKGLLARLRPGHYHAEYGASYYTWSFVQLKGSLIEAGLSVHSATGFNWMPFTRDVDLGVVGPLTRAEGALGFRKLVNVSPWVLVAATPEHSASA